jgi:hypothetical protein
MLKLEGVGAQVPLEEKETHPPMFLVMVAQEPHQQYLAHLLLMLEAEVEGH